MTRVLQWGSSLCSVNTGDDPVEIEARKAQFGGGKQ